MIRFLILLLCTTPALAQHAAVVPSETQAPSGPSIPKYNARHTFELHQAALLQKMIKKELSLSPEQERKIDIEFAAFTRGTMEDKPRPILIGYAQNKVMLEGEEIEAGGDTADKLLAEKTPSGDFERPLLIDLLRDHLDALLLPRFQVIVNRWNVLRPPPLDGKFQRLSRALRDPQLGLRKDKIDELFAEIKPIFEGVPKPERQPKYADKYEPQARERVMAKLPPDKAKKLQELLDFLEADYLEWREAGHAGKVYIEALRKLEQMEAKPKPQEADKAAVPPDPNTKEPKEN